ncbi:Histone-lysine N-methyltransferase SETMAR [Habropoda laboriosa]|uniref:Histone-lysine N-methyltransferase SETMAR n=1 Tax=Habropoda laboriosa TaxID=597456 RepID=A0A0L7R088_9HYME|nr:Histone-lysine N-methyltransferase SETMAR [Habropoda laboriosa]
MHKKLFVKQASLITPARTYHNSRFAKIHESGCETLKHPPYSPDLSLTDYHFFKHFDNFLREEIFRNKEDAVNTFVEFINSRTPDFYCNGIGTLVKRWKKCIKSF